MKNYNVCVVGAGNWGRNHIRTLDSLKSLGGIVEKDKLVIEKLKIDYPECKFYDNLDDALDQGFDGFTIATPPAFHFHDAKKIIGSGFHVLVEKPLTLNKQDALELCDLAKQNGINLMVGHLLLFHPAFTKIKQIMDNGDLGKLQYIYSNRLNLGTIRSDENVFWSFAPHDISLFQYFFQNNPTEVVSRGIDILQPGIHDSTITSLKYPNNTMGHIFVSWLHPFKEHRFVIVGSEGMIHFEDSLSNKPLLFYDKSVMFEGDNPITDIGPTKQIDYNLDLPLTLEMKYFINHLNGDKIEIANGESAVEVINVLEKATNSLKQRLK